MKPRCGVESCNDLSSSRGWCKGHYEWARRRNFEEDPHHEIGKAHSPGKPQKPQGSSKNWTRENLAWAAGFIDGEGSISIKNVGEIEISAFQKDKELLERLQRIFSTGAIYSHPDGYSWKLCRKLDVYPVLVALYSWFSTRRQNQVRSAIQHAFSDRATT